MDPGRSDAGRALARTCLTAAAIPTAGSLLLAGEIGADKPISPAMVPDFLGKVGPGVRDGPKAEATETPEDLCSI
jgi:hypothetical protein